MPGRGRKPARNSSESSDEEVAKQSAKKSTKKCAEKLKKPKENPRIPLLKTVTFPVTDKDEEIVKCGTCQQEISFRQFRIHNIMEHYNLAVTDGDTVEQDRRFFSRQLSSMAKLLKIVTFDCPKENCEHRYKSALGLAIHLETCGKSEAEILADLLPCDVCGKKFSTANLLWHKKSHKESAENSVPEGQKSTKRKSAVKASNVIKKNVESTGKQGKAASKAEKADKDFKVEVEEDIVVPERKRKVPALKTSTSDSTTRDIGFHASSSLYSAGDEILDIWDKPVRSTVNIFEDLTVNPLICYETENEALLYIPCNFESLKFRTKTSIPDKKLAFSSTEFHSLSLFESEITDSISGNNLINVGGPVSAMSWHPSGKYLAVSTLVDFIVKPNILKNTETFETCIQIYRNVFDSNSKDSVNGLDLALVLGIANGYIHHLQWSQCWPSACDSDSTNNEDDDIIGHLAYACADSTLCILLIRKSDLNSNPNLSLPTEATTKIRMYKKVPEIRLKLNDRVSSNVGQCITFDWHENFEYLAAGFGKGLVAVYNLKTSSPHLRIVTKDSEDNTTVEIEPIWYIRAHLQAVISVQFNPSNPRYLVTCSHDYYVKTWDLDLRTEMECKKVGMALAACWVRGWIHVIMSSEISNLNFQSANVNTVRIFQVGSTKMNINCADQLNVTCLSFFQGMIAQGGELGRVTISYYDGFLRECDYDRSKKKKNTVDFSHVNIEKSTEGESNQDGDDAKLIFTLLRHTREAYSSVQEPKPSDLEQYINYYNVTRINKINWCPTGQQLATGYNSGILAVTPVSFDTLFANYYGRRSYRPDLN